MNTPNYENQTMDFYEINKKEQIKQHTTPSPPFDNELFNNNKMEDDDESWKTIQKEIEKENKEEKKKKNKKNEKKKKKKKRVKKACIACRKSKVACSEGRPCKRCLKKGIPCIDESVEEKKVQDVLKDENQFKGRTTFKRKRAHNKEEQEYNMEDDQALERSYLQTRFNNGSHNAGEHKQIPNFSTGMLPPLEPARTNTPLLSSAEYTKRYAEEQQEKGNNIKMDIDDDLVDMLDMTTPQGDTPIFHGNIEQFTKNEDSIFNEPLNDIKNETEFLDQFTYQAIGNNRMIDIEPQSKMNINSQLSNTLSELSLKLQEHDRHTQMNQEMKELMQVSHMQQNQIKQAMDILNQQRNLIKILKRETGMLTLAPSPMISTAMYNLPPGLWDRYASNRNLGIFVFTRQGNLSLVGFNNTVMNILKLHAHQLSHTNYTYSDMLKDVFRTTPTEEEMRNKQKFISCYHGMAFPVRVTWKNLESVIKVVIRVHDEYLWWVCLDFSLVLPPWDLKNSTFHKNAAKRCPKREAVEAHKRSKQIKSISY